jgi:phosphatidylglycerophosphatase A
VDRPAVVAAPASAADRAALLVLSGGGLGFLPLVPGTFGTLGGVLVALALPADRWGVAVLAAVAAASVLTVLLARGACRAAGREDPPAVVMDEVAGFLVAVALVPAPSPLEMAAAFLLFRAFDLWKPWPARAVERLHGGWGILLDDIVAGAYALAALEILRHLHPLR